ncbi:hypothetical protein ACT2CC_00710 [Candidatus Vidania fulgoroideorum]
MRKFNNIKNKISFYFKYNKKQYFYEGKHINILVDKYNKLQENDILLIKKIISTKLLSAFFLIKKVFFIKKKAIKFKRRKRYKKIFGYKNKYVKIKLIKVF